MSRSYTSSPPSASMACNETALLYFYFLYMLSYAGIGLCDGLITRPEESYRASYCVIKKPQYRGGQSPSMGCTLMGEYSICIEDNI
jgi:hypothetical protein